MKHVIICLILYIISATCVYADSDLYIRKDGKKWGAIEENGNIVIPYIYDELYWRGDYILARKGYNGWGMLNKKGEIIFPLIYSSLNEKDGYIFAYKGSKCGIYDKKGRVIHSIIYDDDATWDYSMFSTGLTFIKKGGKWGFVNSEDKEVVPFKYKRDDNIYNGFSYYIKLERASLIKLQLDKLWGFFNKAGENVIPFIYEDATDMYEDYATVKKNGKWGLIDSQGEVVVDFIYDDAQPYYSGVAAVKKEKKWGVIDCRGKVVLPFTEKDPTIFLDNIGIRRSTGIASYDVKDFSNYTRRAIRNTDRLSSYTYIVDKRGNVITSGEYNYHISDGLIYNNKEGVYNSNGKLLKGVKPNKKYFGFFVTDSYFGVYSGDSTDHICDKGTGKTLIDGLRMYSNNYDNMAKQANWCLQHIDSIPETWLAKNSTNRKGINALNNNFAKEPTMTLEDKHGSIPTHGQQPTPMKQSKLKQQITSDVDLNLPTNVAPNNENTFAIIIANEDYQDEIDVEYAANDGRIFKEYCSKVLGLPEDNIHYRENATLNNIKREVSWISKVCKAYNGAARVIFYYAGHGIPSESSRNAYILPTDGIGTDLSTCYPLGSLYNQLGEMQANRVIVFLDACFSGSQRGEGMLSKGRGVAIKPKKDELTGNVVVISATKDDETAHPFSDKGHGLFTYFLLKKLRETNGNVTLGELSDYIKTQVSRKSIVSNAKSQTPSINYSYKLQNTWSSWRLK